jgi:2-succinyl-5-enolpyruvyl-6-hydroxy-3-cyclohexene-1-carboxylate synthase
MVELNLLTENYNRLWSSLLIQQLEINKILNFVVSPGLRNLPLISAIQANKNSKLYTCIDERAAAYRALGMSKASGRPTVLICTSGTAGANYYPAIIEAAQTDFPLFIITADRPPELHWANANQTIDQSELYGKYAKTFNSPVPGEDVSLNEWATFTQKVINDCSEGRRPVHLNLPFREPLDQTNCVIPAKYIDNFSSFRSISKLESIKENNPNLDLIIEDWNNSTNPLIIIGSLQKESQTKEFVTFINNLKATVCADITSGLTGNFSNELPSFEARSSSSQNNYDLVFHIGGRVTSKHYYNFLKSNKSKTIMLNNDKLFCNPSFIETEYVLINTKSLIDKPFLPKNVTVLKVSKTQLIQSSPDQANLYKDIPIALSEFSFEKHSLFLGNSSVIRDFDQYFFNREIGGGVFSQRGTSGIEGNIAHALGIQDGLEIPMTIIIGDISAIHDLNSLLMLNTRKKNFICIIVNNFSGGIFGRLNIQDKYNSQSIISTPHKYQLAKITNLNDINSVQVKNSSQFIDAYKLARENQTANIIEVVIDE